MPQTAVGGKRIGVGYTSSSRGSLSRTTLEVGKTVEAGIIARGGKPMRNG